jgi:hypothetical protein
MAVGITETNFKSSRYVSPLSRYQASKVIYWSDKNYLTFETYKKPIHVNSNQDMFTVISPSQEFRPDKVSQDMYGVTDFWWKIMEVNKIKDVFDFRSGLSIRLPGGIY